ncbi:MAG: flagellar export chaperone FlgN [Oscillospiraceae bacterium]|nr:flagellar export chaperone FlgN [Oscillospiraceae bacterium]
MNAEVLKNIKRILTEYLSFYKEFLSFEQNKLEAVEQNRLELLDGLVRQEEVYLLKSKGMEQNRITFQEENGLGGLKLREIIDMTNNSDKDELLTIFTELNGVVNEIQHTNEKCSIAIKTRLSAIERAMDKIKNENAQALYDGTANTQKNGRALFMDKA